MVPGRFVGHFSYPVEESKKINIIEDLTVGTTSLAPALLCLHSMQHRKSHHDMNVELAWEQDIIGRGAVVSILDDGEHNLRMLTNTVTYL